jgi:hypothetical protein
MCYREYQLTVWQQTARNAEENGEEMTSNRVSQ